MRRFVAHILAALCSGAASAADVADLEVLGFSADGNVFAFEEHGVHDGSGYPYSRRFYVDVDTDGFLPGTPIKVRLEDETATLEQARAESRRRGEALFSDAELARHKGQLAAFNPPTELSADPNRLVVSNRPFFPGTELELEFRLEQVPRNDAAHCFGAPEANGFRLLRIRPSPGGQTEVLHEDRKLPASRGCPFAYRIGGLQILWNDGQPAYAVLISVISQGFEGADHGWMAVTGRP